MVEIRYAVAHPQERCAIEPAHRARVREPRDAVVVGAQEASDLDEGRPVHGVGEAVDTIGQPLEGDVYGIVMDVFLLLVERG